MARRKKRRRRASRRGVLAVLFTLAGMAGLLGVANYFLANLPDVSPLLSEDPRETAMMRERGGARTAPWVPLDRIAPILVRAVLVGEDANFYGHEGFDTHEIEEAIKRNWEEGRTVRGASTITQQLAKNLYLSSDRTYWRKLKEAVLTYRLEQTLTKDRILEIYLNVIEWGRRAVRRRSGRARPLRPLRVEGRRRPGRDDGGDDPEPPTTPSLREPRVPAAAARSNPRLSSRRRRSHPDAVRARAVTTSADPRLPRRLRAGAAASRCFSSSRTAGDSGPRARCSARRRCPG